MNTHAERAVIHSNRRALRFAYLSRLASWVNLKFKAYRTHRSRIEALESLRAMSPELLDDIGIGIDVDKLGKPTLKLADHNPHVIAIAALKPSRHYHDPS